MSIITSNQQKRQTTIDPILIMFVSVLLVLLVFAISAANGTYFVEKVLHTNAPAGLSLNSQVSFAADQGYWSEYCESGWSTDAICDAIVARAQACSISAESAYCSAYESYLQEFNR